MEKLLIKKEDGSSFHNIELHEFTYTDNVMADTFLSGSFMYPTSDLVFTKKEYVEFKLNRYYLLEPPAISFNGGSLSDNGMTKYDCKFVSDKDYLANIPFTDEAITSAESNYRTGGRNVKFFGTIEEFVLRLNAVLIKNAPNSGWTAKLQDGFIPDTEVKEFSFDDQFVNDVLKTMYDSFNVPYYIETKTIYIGVPTYELSTIFEYGQGNGLQNKDRTPKKNKVITRIAGHGSADNIPFRYPLIKDEAGKEILHPYSRPYLMPTIYVDAVKRKVLQGSNEPLIDYYDADNTYPTPINNQMPSFHIQNFEEIKPTIQGVKYDDIPIDQINDVYFDKDDNDNINSETGEIEHSYFDIKLNPMGFDLWACAAITGEMGFSMKSGDCMGSEFKIAINEDAFKASFYEDDGTFNPDKSTRDYTRFPNSTNQVMKVKVSKDIDTFGWLMPNQYQKPKTDDKFVILHIELPQTYIDEAQLKLDESLTKYMRENNFDKYEYPCKFDEYFLINNPKLADEIRTNALVPFRYNGELLKLPISQITIKYGAAIYQYEIKLTDEISITLNSVGKIEDGLEKLDNVFVRGEIENAKQASNFYRGLGKVEKGLFDSEGNSRIALLEALLIKANAIFVGQEANNFSVQNTKVATNGLNAVNIQSGTVLHFNVSRSIEYYDITQAIWNIVPQSFTGIDITKDYYLYIRANRGNDSALWVMDTKQHLWNEHESYYYFLWGQLNIVDNTRILYPTFGISTIMGGQYTGQLFKSPNFSIASDAGMLIDMLNAKIFMGKGAEILTHSLTLRRPDSEDIDMYEYTESTTENIDAINNELTVVNGRIDGITESFYENYDPDLTNEPAKGWISEGTEERHLKTSFTNFKSGASWLWTKNNLNIYGWGVITNTEILNALKVAGEAKEAAALAKATAESAQTSANTANSLISDIANDDKLTADEKQNTKKEWDIIESEKTKNNVSASTFGVSSTVYTNSYNLLNSYITPLLDNLNVTSDIEGTTFRTNFKSYYDARTDLLNAISLKAKTLADNAQSTATGADKIAKEAKEDALHKSIAAQWSSGKILYKDPTFSLGDNGVFPYVSGAGGVWGNMRIASTQPYIPAGSPILSPYMYMCETTAMPNVPKNRYGFAFATPSRAGAIFVTRIIANIPIGFVISFASNAIGSPYKHIWSTPRVGTGKWEEYIVIVFCGKDGTFHNTNYYYLERMDMNDPTTAPLSYSRWFVSYATVSDITDARNAALDAVQSLDRQKAMADDNIISREEKVALRNENTQIVKQYNSLKTLAGASVNTTYLDTAYNDVQILFGSGFVNIASDTDYTFKGGEKNTYNTYLANWAFQCNRISELIAQKQLDDLSIGGVNILNIFPNKTNTIYKSNIANNDEYGHHPQFFELTQQNYRDIEKAGALTIAFDYNIQNAKLRTLGNTFIGFSFWIKYTDGSVINPYYNPDGGTKILYDGNTLNKKGTLVSVTTIDKTKTIDSITSTQPYIYIRNITQGSAEYTNFRWYVGSKDIGYQPTQREQEEYAKERADAAAIIAAKNIPINGLHCFIPLNGSNKEIYGGIKVSNIGTPTYFNDPDFGMVFRGQKNVFNVFSIPYPFRLFPTAFSVSAKVLASSLYDYGCIAGNHSYNGIVFGQQNSGKISFSSIEVDFSKYLNTWVNIVFTYSSGAQKLYFDGSLVGSKTTTLDVGGFTDMYLGQAYWGSNRQWDGLISDFAIHSRALSPKEVSHMAQSKYDYISDSFEQASKLDTTIQGGLFLTSVIGLKNAAGKLKAFFSGLTTGKTSDIAIATGIPDDGNINNAKTRIMMNGAFHAEEAFISGLIMASSGKLGGFSLNGNSISNLDELGGVVLTKDNISSVQSLLAQTTTTPANYVEKTYVDTITSANYTYPEGSIAPRNVSSVVGVQLANAEMLYSLEMNISYLNYSTSAPSITLIPNLKIEIWIGNFQGGTIQVGEFKLDKPTQSEGNPAANVKLNFSTTPNNSFLYLKVVGLSITISGQSAYFLALKNIKIIKSVTTTIYANDGFGIASSSSNFIYYKKGYGFAMKIDNKGGKAYIDGSNYLRFDPNL